MTIRKTYGRAPFPNRHTGKHLVVPAPVSNIEGARVIAAQAKKVAIRCDECGSQKVSVRVLRGPVGRDGSSEPITKIDL